MKISHFVAIVADLKLQQDEEPLKMVACGVVEESGLSSAAAPKVMTVQACSLAEHIRIAHLHARPLPHLEK